MHANVLLTLDLNPADLLQLELSGWGRHLEKHILASQILIWLKSAEKSDFTKETLNASEVETHLKGTTCMGHEDLHDKSI